MSGINGNENRENMAEETAKKGTNAQKFTEIAPMAETLEQRRVPEPAENKKTSWAAKFITAFDDHMSDFYQDVLNHVKTLQ